MKHSIPELKNYNGCKGGNGVYQQIISVIPPHKILVVPFLGHCGITRHIKPADILIGVDASQKVINAWKNYLKNTLKYDVIYDSEGVIEIFVKIKNTLGNLPKRIELYCQDAFIFIQNQLLLSIPEHEFKHTVLYLDPPYPFSTRKSNVNIYDFEMTDNQHQHLLSLLIGMRFNVIISSYKNEMYNNGLLGWNTHSFSVGTRKGKATETIYYNFNNDYGLLHDYRFLGTDFKDRERIRLKVSRWVNRLEKLDPKERMSIVSEIIKTHSNGY